MAVDEAAATVSMESQAANHRVGQKIKTWSVIVATRESPFGRLMFERSTVGTVVHDVETKVDKLKLI